MSRTKGSETWTGKVRERKGLIPPGWLMKLTQSPHNQLVDQIAEILWL